MPSDEVTKGADAPAKKTATAVKLASKQQEIAVSEFFEKNKQILGFDSRSKSLLMGIKEAVDNSLDACEEANILPEVSVNVERLNDEDYRVTIEDNGPGIVHKMMPNVFGRLLYGSRFHALRQSRGQQGIGISATVMYGNITTGKPAHAVSKIEGEDEVAWGMDIVIDTKTNRPIVTNDKAFTWEGKDHGTIIQYTTKGRYVTGKQSIFEYLKETAIVNAQKELEVAKLNAEATVEKARAEAEAEIEVARAEAETVRLKSIEVARALGFTITETTVTDEDGAPSVLYEIDFTGKSADEIALITEYLKYADYLAKWDGKLPTMVGGDSASVLIPMPSDEPSTTP